MRRRFLRPAVSFFLSFAFLVIFFSPSASFALVNDSKGEESVSSQPEVISNRILVKFKREVHGQIKGGNPKETGVDSINQLNKELGVKKFERLAKEGGHSLKDHELFGWYVLTLDTPEEKIQEQDHTLMARRHLHEALNKLKKDPAIETAEPDYVVHTFSTPNDPYYSSSGSWGQPYDDLWGLKKINASAAWELSTGSSNIIVADIDTGVDRNHPDLAANMWVNTQEIPGNGIDDDHNGYVDDYYGWDFANNDNDPMDDFGHGTHTAGTIGAVGNNGIGVVGVNWNVKIMALKFLDANGSGSLDNAIQALQYAADNGARVSNNSWGANGFSRALDDAVRYEHDKGMVVEASAGNSAADAVGFAPANSDGVITTGASDHTDTLAFFSNFGPKIDVVAPGGGDDRFLTYAFAPHRSILSLKSAVISSAMTGNGQLIIGSNYVRQAGTSMSGPHVAGLAALILSKNLSLTPEEVRQIIRLSADDVGAAGRDTLYGFGRINAGKALAMASSHLLAPFLSSPRSRTLFSNQFIDITGGVPGPGFSSFRLEVGSGRTPSNWTEFASSNTQVLNGKLGTLDISSFSDGTYTIRLSATDTSGKHYEAQVFDLTVDNMTSLMSLPIGMVGNGTIEVRGTAATNNGLAFGKYVLEWGVGTNPTSWSTAGITLANGGLSSVANGILGNWDTRALTENSTYSLRLTVYAASGANSAVTNALKKDSELVPGWPKRVATDWRGRTPAGLVAADINNDGSMEMIFTESPNLLHAYKKDGSELPGFPFYLPVPPEALYPYAMDVNVADVDGDHLKEIFVGLHYEDVHDPRPLPLAHEKIFLVKSNGTLYPGWNPIVATEPSPGADYEHNPSIADLNGDGQLEFVYGETPEAMTTSSGKIHAVHLDGSELPGFPVSVRLVNFIWNSPSLVDLYGDGKRQILASAAEDGRIFLINPLGQILPGWPVAIKPLATGDVFRFSYGNATAADIDGDGVREIFIYGINYSRTSGNTELFFGFKLDGSPLPGYPVTLGVNRSGNDQGSPVVANFDSNAQTEEILLGDPDLNLFSVGGLVKSLWAFSNSSRVTLADITGDGKPDYGINLRGSIGIINGGDGRLYRNKYSGGYMVSPLFADFDRNGKMEMFTSGTLPSGDPDYFNYHLVYLFEIPPISGQATPPDGWPMVQNNPARSGRFEADYTPPPLDTTPPTVSITSPASGTTTTSAQTVTITASASDNVGVSSVEFYDGGVLKGSDTSSPYTYNWAISSSDNATHPWTAKATDAAGNNAVSSPAVSLTVNIPPGVNHAPSVNAGVDQTITLPNSASLSGTATDDGLPNPPGAMTFSWSMVSGPGTVTFGSPSALSTTASFSIAGSYVLRLTANDGAVSVSDDMGVTVNSASDTTPPTVSITSPTDGSTVSRNHNVTIQASASDNVKVSRVEFYVDGVLIAVDTTSSYSAKWRVPSPRGTVYTLKATAYDAAGNATTSAEVKVSAR